MLYGCKKKLYSNGFLLICSAYMAKSSQVNIRFDDATDADLEKTAAKLGISKSALVRHLTTTFLDEVKRRDALPIAPDWARALGGADGRSGWGQRKIVEMDLQKVADEAGQKVGPVKKVNYKESLKEKKS